MTYFYSLLLRYSKVLNTILYNSNDGIKDKVNKRLRNTSTSTTAATASTTGPPSIKDNVSGHKKASPRHMPYCKECFSYYWDSEGEWNQPIKEEEIPN